MVVVLLEDDECSTDGCVPVTVECSFIGADLTVADSGALLGDCV